MPFQDLPHRREDSAPVLNLADPCEIWRYFDDLEFLFLKHRVSDNQEKKRAAVRYPSVAVERLWKTARAFGDPACSYEDFKAEVIALYPEAIAAQEHTLADLDMLLGAYYCEFLIISRFLIAKSRISAPTQARYLLASFEPRLATAIHARLERRFPDHLPDDPYDTEAIYDAALYVLAWQRTAPFVDPLRDILILSPSSLAPPTPLTSPPPTVHAFPLATESLSPIPSDPRTATHALKQEHAASLVPAPRDAAPPFTTSAETSKPIPTMPPPVQAFPPVLQFVQADAPATVPTFAPKCAAPLISAARDVLLPSASTLAPRAPVLPTPTPVNAFLTAPEPAQPAQPDATAATLDALAEAIASLKSGLEAILDTQKSAESRAPDPEAAQSRSERCKFCGSSTHLEEECEEADEYILAGMCKRNVFGRLTLPSGAEVSRRIKGKFLRERFEEYHRQYPGQRAAPAYLEDLARPGRLALQEVTPVTPSVMGATSPGAEAMHPATFEVLRQPHRPERTVCDPRAASDQARAPDTSGNLRKHTVRFSGAPGVPKSAARPVPGQSEHQRTSAVTSSAQSQMRESNFAATAASDCGEAPLMVSQRGLFAFVPGVRSETVHAAASTPAPPRECAVYLVQRAAPQHACDRVPGSAKPSKCPQAPAPSVEACANAVRTESPSARPASPSARTALLSARDTSQVPCSTYKPACVMPSGSIPSSPRAVLRSSQSKVGRDGRKVVSPTARQPTSVKQSATCRQSTALQLPFHARKPPDVVPSMRDASATLIQRPCDLRDSVRTYTLLTMHSYALAEDWGQSIFQPSPIHCASLTLSDTLDSDATGAQTPAMHADSRSDVSGQRKRLQPAQRRARVPQCNCDDRAICSGSPSHVAMTASEPHSRRFPLPRRHVWQQQAQEQRKHSRSGVPQAASSADTTVSAPQLRGGSYVTHGQADDRAHRQQHFQVPRQRARRNAMRFFQEQLPMRREVQRQHHMRATCASRQTIRDNCQHSQQHSRHPRQRARAAATAPLARGRPRRFDNSATVYDTRGNVYNPRGDVRACRESITMTMRSVEAAPMRAETLATEPHLRRHPRRQRRENNQEQPHQVASSADATASAPQLRGGSHVAIEFQRTLCIDRSVYRSRSSVRDRTRSGSSKTDSQRSKELKRKTAAATTVALRTRRQKHAATCATPADRQQRNFLCKSRSIASPTAATAPALRESSRLMQGSKTVLQVSSSVFQLREGTRDKCDVALGEEHHPMKYIKREHPSDHAASQRTTTQRIARRDHTRDGATLRTASQQQRTTTQRPCGPQTSAAHHTATARTVTYAARHTLQPRARAPSHLAQGFRATPDVNSSVLRFRERVRDKSDLALGQKHPLATHLKRKCISDRAAIARP
ncbi:hypothetical protein EDB85DRAFT_2148244 [Lactarius pseudohatsudake]|nr:hypothetical protein EDB85DRAFT_2148244 [Lactarius pseudohatsudake]